MVSWPYAWARYGRHWPTALQRAWPTVQVLLPVPGGYSLVTKDVTSARMALLGHRAGHMSGHRREAALQIVNAWRAQTKRPATPS